MFVYNVYLFYNIYWYLYGFYFILKICKISLRKDFSSFYWCKYFSHPAVRYDLRSFNFFEYRYTKRAPNNVVLLRKRSYSTQSSTDNYPNDSFHSSLYSYSHNVEELRQKQVSPVVACRSEKKIGICERYKQK